MDCFTFTKHEIWTLKHYFETHKNKWSTCFPNLSFPILWWFLYGCSLWRENTKQQEYCTLQFSLCFLPQQSQTHSKQMVSHTWHCADYSWMLYSAQLFTTLLEESQSSLLCGFCLTISFQFPEKSSHTPLPHTDMLPFWRGIRKCVRLKMVCFASLIDKDSKLKMIRWSTSEKPNRRTHSALNWMRMMSSHCDLVGQRTDQFWSAKPLWETSSEMSLNLVCELVLCYRLHFRLGWGKESSF